MLKKTGIVTENGGGNTIFKGGLLQKKIIIITADLTQEKYRSLEISSQNLHIAQKISDPNLSLLGAALG